MGRPIGKVESDAKLNRIKELFQSFPDGKISFADFDELCRRMDMPIYTKAKFYFFIRTKKSYKINKKIIRNIEKETNKKNNLFTTSAN